MNILSNKDIKRIFYNLGFNNFTVIDDNNYFKEYFADETLDAISKKTYIIDVLPYRLKPNQCDFLDILEDYYLEDNNRLKILREKWINILMKFSCYYKLHSILIAGTSVIGYEQLYKNTIDEKGYVLKFNTQIMTNLTDFFKNVNEKTNGTITFLYKENGLVIQYYPYHEYMVVDFLANINTSVSETKSVTHILRKLSESEGLFLR